MSADRTRTRTVLRDGADPSDGGAARPDRDRVVVNTTSGDGSVFAERGSTMGLAVDVICAVGSTACAVWSFSMTFAGLRFFVAGLIGVVAGVAGPAIARWRGVSRWFAALVTGALLCLFGPAAAVPSTTVGGFPTSDSFPAMYDGAIRGWWRVLTLAPPVGDYQHLFMLPLIAGATGGFIAMALSATKRCSRAAGLGPVLTLVAGVVVGTHDPATLFLTGGTVGIVVLFWSIQLDRRTRPVVGHRRRARSWGFATAILVVAALVGTGVGPYIPGVEATERTVVRDRTLPPFDPSQYPSPLAGYRRYKLPERGEDGGGVGVTRSLLEREVLRIEGNDVPIRLRIAVMDSFDGNVFRFASGDRDSAFRSTGSVVGTNSGPRARLRIRIEALEGVWLPLAGKATRIEFEGERADDLAAALRFNDRHSAGVTVLPTHKGDRYTIDTVLDREVSPEDLCAADILPVQRPLDETLAAQILLASEAKIEAKIAKTLEKAVPSATHDSCTPSMRLALDTQIRVQRAFYDDGKGNEEGVSNRQASGHYLGRIVYYLTRLPAGNEEQSAAVMAGVLRANSLDARVVLGIQTTPKQKSYLGEKVTAWVEVRTREFGWVPLDVKPASKEEIPTVTVETPTGREPQTPPPPPVVSPRTRNGSDDGVIDGTASNARRPVRERASGFDLVGFVKTAALVVIPLVLLFGPPLAVVLLKRRRKRRRRGDPDPAGSIAGAWAETVDFLRDAGKPVPNFATRREIASLNDMDALEGLAAGVDEHLFSSVDPAPSDADLVWQRVDENRAEATARMSKADRWRARLSLASLRSGSDA